MDSSLGALTAEKLRNLVREIGPPPPVMLVSSDMAERLRALGYATGYTERGLLPHGTAYEVPAEVFRTQFIFTTKMYGRDYFPMHRTTPRQLRRAMQRTGWWRKERSHRKRLRSCRHSRRCW